MRALSHYWRVTRQDNVVAQARLEKATAIDPNYGQALGLLAASHMFCAHMGWADMATVVPTAERSALAAIRSDGEDPWAHFALGCVYLFASRRFDNPLAEFEAALRLNPNFSLAQRYYGLAMCYCGRWEEGALAASRAVRLSPRDPLLGIHYGVAAYAQFLGGNYDEATRLARQGIRQRADFVGAHRSSPQGLVWRVRPKSPRPRCRNFGALSPIFRLPGSPRKCRSSSPPSGSNYLEGFRRAGLD